MIKLQNTGLRCWVFSQGTISQVGLPKGPFPKWDFPNVQFNKRQLFKGQVKGLLKQRRLQWGLARRLEQTWEVTTLVNTLWKLSLGNRPLGKYLTSRVYPQRMRIEERLYQIYLFSQIPGNVLLHTATKFLRSFNISFKNKIHI